MNKFILLLAFSLLTTKLVLAGGDDPVIPIDGGLSALVVAGIAFAGKKLWEGNKKGKQELP